jgi:hypothetical protein
MPDFSWKFDVGGKYRGGPETLVDPASTSTNAWFGSVRVNSATAGALYPVATTRAASDSMFSITHRYVGFAPVTTAGHIAPAFAVVSLTSGVGFILRSVASTAACSLFVDWQMRNPRA